MHRLSATLILGLALSAGSAAVLGEEVKIKHNGLTLNADLVTTGDDWTAGPVLLMTHGTLAHGRMEIMSTLQPLLQDRGISSLAITLGLGLDDRHGMYDCQAPHNHRHQDAVDEIGAWLEWLKQQGAGEISLMGHSRGGNQTAWFVSRHEDPALSKVILVAPGATNPEKEAADYQKRFGVPLAPVLAEAQRLVDDGQGDAWMENIGFVYCENAKATAASVLAYHAPGPEFNTPVLVEQITLPVLIIGGSGDTVVPDVATTYADLADKGVVSFTVIDGADHMFRDLYADEVADAIESFLID